MITKNMIKDGIDAGLITFIIDPNLKHGTVCKIGDYWFYFGSMEADEVSPDVYLRNNPPETIVNEIFTTLESFRQDEDFVDEYHYYESYLRSKSQSIDLCYATRGDEEGCH